MYKKYRFYFRFILALLSKYKKVILLALFFGSITFVSMPQILKIIPPISTTKKVAIVGRFTLTDLPQTIQTKISRGLTTVDEQGQPQPAIATDWTATDSGKTYIFNLDQNLNWQDGEPLKSSDIRYGFSDSTFEYPNDYQLVVKLNDPYTPLPVVVSRPVFKLTSTTGIFAQSQIIGVGDYTLKRYRKNGNFLVSAYLAPADPVSNSPKLEYHFYPTLQQARTAFKLGLVNSIENISDLGELKDWPNVQVKSELQTDRYVAIFFNTQDPLFVGQSGKNLRLALNYAIDKTRWDNRAVGPISLKSWAYVSDLKSYDKDLTRAQNFLKNVEVVPQEITISTVITYLSTAEQIKTDWEALGIKVNLQVSPEIPSEYQVLLIAQAIPADPDQYNLWHSYKESTNLSRLKNPRIDKFLEDGRKTESQAERKKLYIDFQKFLLDENPAVFLYYPHLYTINRD